MIDQETLSFDKQIIIATHSYFVDGMIHEVPTSTLTEILRNESRSFIFIRHSIDGQLPSTSYVYKNGEVAKTKKLFVLRKISFLRYISEVVSTFSYFFFRKKRREVYIGIDPLNAFTGILLKKVGKVTKVVFYTADYADVRFKNKIMNYFYHRIDKFCVKNADVTWNVSMRIFEKRKEMGLSDHKNVFVPNTPSNAYQRSLKNKRDRYGMVTLGILGDQLDFKGIIDAFSELISKYPQLTFQVAGGGPKKEEYEKYVVKKNLQKRIFFLGQLSHEQALEKISKSGLGLALYNGNWHFNYYGDSMKCREFLCFSLPVITTNTHSTAEEIQKFKAGVVCDTDKEDYKNAIIDILENYEEYSRNSSLLGRKYKNIHLKLLKDISQ